MSEEGLALLIEETKNIMVRSLPEDCFYKFYPRLAGLTHVVMMRIRPYDWQPIAFFCNEHDAKLFVESKQNEAIS